MSYLYKKRKEGEFSVEIDEERKIGFFGPIETGSIAKILLGFAEEATGEKIDDSIYKILEKKSSRKYAVVLLDREFNDDAYARIKEACEKEGLKVTEPRVMQTAPCKVFGIYKEEKPLVGVKSSPFGFDVNVEDAGKVFDEEHENGLIDKLLRKIGALEE